MIKTITLNNFQSHKETMLNLHPGVNVIIGPSDSGKTAVLRALNWVINNRPSGESFRSHWGGDTEVEVRVDERIRISKEVFDKSFKVKRSKGKSVNQYDIQEGNANRGGQVTLKAMGQKVPEDVSVRLNMDEINIQRQLDAPFLLSESPGEVARVLNSVASLDSIDRANSHINHKARSISSMLANDEVEVQRLAQELDDYSYLEDIASQLKRAERRSEELEETEDQLDALSDLIETIENRLDTRKEIEKTLQHSSGIDSLCEMKEGLDKRREEHYQLTKIVSDLEVCRSFTTTNKERLEELEERFHELMPEECPLCGRGGK